MKEKSMNNCGIYKITNKKNGKFYIGSSKHIDRRWWEHKNDLIKNNHYNSKLQHAWNYHGADVFEFTILENVNDDKLLEREKFYLDMFKPYIRGIGYNISDIASGSDTFTYNPNKELIREKYQQKWSGSGNHMFGKNHTEESKKLQKEKSVGRYTLEWFRGKYGDEDGMKRYEDRNAALKSRKMNYSYDNGLTGTKRGPMSDENKKKISDNKKRIKLIRNDIMSDIKSGKYTIKVISEKYDISVTMVKYYKKKI